LSTDWFRLSHTRFLFSLALVVYRSFFYIFFGFIYKIVLFLKFYYTLIV